MPSTDTQDIGSTPQVVLRTGNLAVRLDNRFASERLIVTFSHWRPERSLEAEGWLENLLPRLGWAAAHVVCADNDWFLYPETPEAIRLLAGIGKSYREVICCGSSMGGYQALRAAKDLGARRAIALIPQFSIDRAKVPFETRWADEIHRVQFQLEGDLLPAPSCDY